MWQKSFPDCSTCAKRGQFTIIPDKGKPCLPRDAASVGTGTGLSGGKGPAAEVGLYSAATRLCAALWVHWPTGQLEQASLAPASRMMERMVRAQRPQLGLQPRQV
jgi:hypothetical protein